MNKPNSPNNFIQQQDTLKYNNSKTEELTKSALCIKFCNLRSIVNKYDYVLSYLNSNKDTDILFIAETWLNSSIEDAAIWPPGYNIMREDRSSSTGGGVCLYNL